MVFLQMLETTSYNKFPSVVSVIWACIQLTLYPVVQQDVLPGNIRIMCHMAKYIEERSGSEPYIRNIDTHQNSEDAVVHILYKL